jgi:hypothetical protein
MRMNADPVRTNPTARAGAHTRRPGVSRRFPAEIPSTLF